MSCVTVVDPYWLAELGPMYFSVKGELSKNKTKAQLEREGQTAMAQEIEKAKRKK